MILLPVVVCHTTPWLWTFEFFENCFWLNSGEKGNVNKCLCSEKSSSYFVLYGFELPTYSLLGVHSVCAEAVDLPCQDAHCQQEQNDCDSQNEVLKPFRQC